jgi:gluconolactonase
MAASDYEVLDERFGDLVREHEKVQPLFGDCRWAEGPVYLPASRSLVWSDVPADRLLRWDETTGAVGVLRSPSHYSNGNTVDREGRLVTCEQGARRVTRTEPDGSITVLADRVDGRLLNSPNDVVVRRSDGSIWFTDPTYGIDSHYEGHRAESEAGGSHVYRIDPAGGGCAVVADDFVQPNGLAFSLDERRLYVADTGESHVPDGPRHIRAFDVGEDGRLSGGDVLATCTAGVFDGFRLDEDGRIWVGAGDGVHCLAPDGTLLGKVRVAETVANVAFGGPRRSRLFICASSSLHAVHVAVTGAAGALGGDPL